MQINSGQGLPGLEFRGLRMRLGAELFERLSSGAGSIGLAQWQQALQQLPDPGRTGAANPAAGLVGTGTASAVDAAFRSMDANGDGQVSQQEFGTALDGMLDRLRHRRRQGGPGTPLEAQLLAQNQGAVPSGAVAAPEFLRRVLLGYAAAA